MKNHAFFSSKDKSKKNKMSSAAIFVSTKDKSKKIKCCLLQFLFGTLRLRGTMSCIFTEFLQLLDRIFFLIKHPENLDPSYKMDLDLWDCLERVELVLQQNFMGLI